jgi:hypothetical protein
MLELDSRDEWKPTIRLTEYTPQPALLRARHGKPAEVHRDLIMDINRERKMDAYPIYHQLNIAMAIDEQMRLKGVPEEDPRRATLLADIARFRKQLASN